MLSPLFIAWIWLIVSVIVDILANWALKRSEGFSNKLWGILSIVLVSAAFGCMGQVILVMPLALAYALWCVMGIFGTTALSIIVFKQYLSKQKYAAIGVLTLGVVLMNIA